MNYLPAKPRLVKVTQRNDRAMVQLQGEPVLLGQFGIERQKTDAKALGLFDDILYQQVVGFKRNRHFSGAERRQVSF